MEDKKNLILAIVLCLIILFGWGYFAQYMGWVQTPDPAEMARQQEVARQEAEERKAETAKAATLPTFTPAEGRDLRIDSPLYEAVLYTGGGPLRSFKLKEYHTELEKTSPLVNMVDEYTAAVAPLGLVINGQPSWSTGQWSMESPAGNQELAQGQETVVRLVGLVDNLRVERELTFSADSYLIKEKLRLINAGDQARSARVRYTVAADASNANASQYDAMRIAWDMDGSLDEESSEDTLQGKGVQTTGKIYWAGAMSTYFMAAILPGDPNGVTVRGLMQRSVYRAAVEEPEIMLAPAETKELTVSYWIGPKDRTLLLQVSDELAKSIDLGMFSAIAKALIWLLSFFYAYVHNWGVAIILLTILIKAVFWPLTAKSYASMEKMKKLQPMMQTLREKYKDDKERMNKELEAANKRVEAAKAKVEAAKNK